MRLIREQNNEKIYVRIIDDVDSILKQIISIANKKGLTVSNDDKDFDVVLSGTDSLIKGMLNWLIDITKFYEEKGFDDVIEWIIK